MLLIGLVLKRSVVSATEKHHVILVLLCYNWKRRYCLRSWLETSSLVIGTSLLSSRTHDTHVSEHTHIPLRLHFPTDGNQHVSSAIQQFHLVSSVDRFIMSNASVTFTSCIFILQQCLPLKCKEVSIGEYHVYCFGLCLHKCRFAYAWSCC